MDDINLRSNNLDEQIIKCFDKYINEPIPDGGGVLPNKVLDKSLDLIYKHLINKEQSELINCGHISILIYNYYFEKCKDRKVTQLKFKKFLQSVKVHKEYKLKINIFA